MMHVNAVTKSLNVLHHMSNLWNKLAIDSSTAGLGLYARILYLKYLVRYQVPFEKSTFKEALVVESPVAYI